MIARLLALIALLLPAALFAAPPRETAGDLNYVRPDGWNRTVDPEEHLVILVPVVGHASVTFMTGQDYPEDGPRWHQYLWRVMTKEMKPAEPINEGKQGQFLSMTGHLVRADGTPVWMALYSLVRDGRGEGILYIGQNADDFRSYADSINRMVDGVRFSPAAASPAIDHEAEKSVAVPDAVTLAVPPGWTSQEDPNTHLTLMKPPEAASVEEAVLMVLPPKDASGSPESFNMESLALASKGFQLLEPVQRGKRNGMLASIAHYSTPQGKKIRLVLYTARWGSKGQAVVFAASRDDLFKACLPAVHAAISGAVIPGAPKGVAPAATENPGPAPFTPPASVPGNPSFQPRATATMNAAEPSDLISVLNYNEPANFYRGATKSFADYTSNEVKFTLCVYPFRKFSGNIVANFQQTLLRDWVDPMYQEAQLAGRPVITPNNLPGATAVYDARFHEAQIGQVNERMRILIVSGDMAALIDATAPNAFCWQKAGPSFTAMLASLHVDKKQGPPSLDRGPGPGGAALAGLYGGTKPKYMALGLVDFTSHVLAPHYYLFSADGRVFRCYDQPPAGGDWRRFDFDNAQRTDPGNTGRFALRGNELYLKMGGPQADEVTTRIDDPTTLTLDTVQYRKETR